MTQHVINNYNPTKPQATTTPRKPSSPLGQIYQMGPITSKQTGSDYSRLLLDFNVLQRLQAENVTFLRGLRDCKTYLLREFTFNDRREFEAQSQILQRKKAQLEGCQHLLQLQRILTQSEDQFCSSYFKVHALFEWEPRWLEDEINERNLQKIRFEQRELWSIAASCILALSHLQRQGIPHRCLSSKALMLSESGMLRVYDPIALAAQPNIETLIAKRSTPHLYIAPEECEQLEQENIHLAVNRYKSDVWTLGMILLEAGLAQYQDECYRDEFSRIHWETLHFNIGRFAQLHSPELAILLELMLTREEALRPDWLDMEQRLAKEENNRSARSSSASQQSQPEKQRFYQQIVFSEPARSTSFTPNMHLPTPTSMYRPPPVSSPQVQVLTGSAVVCVAPSQIDSMRPRRSIFPTPIYSTTTKVDQNLIYLPDEYSEASDTPNRQDYEFNSVSRRQGSVGELRNRQASAKAFTPLIQALQPETVVEKYKQGSEYRGQKWRGMRHGYGIFLYLDGGRYEGDWCFNKMQGKGRLYYQSGKLAYDGDWVDDQFSGKGILYNQEPQSLFHPYPCESLDQVQDYWIKYEGQFKADMKRGKGTLYLTNGETFEGQFLSDVAEGPGRFTKKNGTQVVGTWSNNKLIST